MPMHGNRRMWPDAEVTGLPQNEFYGASSYSIIITSVIRCVFSHAFTYGIAQLKYIIIKINFSKPYIFYPNSSSERQVFCSSLNLCITNTSIQKFFICQFWVINIRNIINISDFNSFVFSRMEYEFLKVCL